MGAVYFRAPNDQRHLFYRTFRIKERCCRTAREDSEENFAGIVFEKAFVSAPWLLYEFKQYTPSSGHKKYEIFIVN